MLRYFVITVLLFSCKKQAEPVEHQPRLLVDFPSCEEDPLFCDDEFEDLPEHDVKADTGE